MEDSFYENIFYAETNTNNEKGWAYYKKGASGSFATALCRAYELGDTNNRHRLELAFPRLFQTARSWFYSENPDDFLNEVLNKKTNKGE